MEKTVVLGVTGSIAAYKACDIISGLKKKGINVHVICSENAARLISPLTLETLSCNQVVSGMFERNAPHEVEHISLAQKAEIFLVAPATANIIGKYACGIADDMLTTTLLATKAPVLFAPAMNTNMYLSDAVQNNLKILRDRGCHIIEPESGLLACGDTGIGKLAGVDKIVDTVLGKLNRQGPLSGKKVIVTAGPTREAIDPVRYISNRSSGKMGYALAEEAYARGADVLLISGPCALSASGGIKLIKVETTLQMREALTESFEDCDILIKAAAPADFKPKNVSGIKLKKADGISAIEVEPAEDILTGLVPVKKHQYIVGFAAETNDIAHYAQKKLIEKNLNMIVANDVSQEGAGFDADTNIVTIYFPDGSSFASLQALPKREVAGLILDEVQLQIS